MFLEWVKWYGLLIKGRCGLGYWDVLNRHLRRVEATTGEGNSEDRVNNISSQLLTHIEHFLYSGSLNMLLTHIAITRTPWGRCSNVPSLTDVETEAQKGWIIFPRSYSLGLKNASWSLLCFYSLPVNIENWKQWEDWLRARWGLNVLRKRPISNVILSEKVQDLW